MKYLNKVLETNEIEEGAREQVEKEYLEAKERMKKLPVSFSEDAEMMLSNHLVALLKRISEKKLIDPIEEEMMGEVSEDAWNYAQELACPMFESHGMAPDRSEIFLVATHMEMAIAAATVVS